ncbi:MAG: carbohydrate ABC transporter permease [Treponema sp.]|nr:carbohydrate ABC transporter permease [Treponema sp.]
MTAARKKHVEIFRVVYYAVMIISAVIILVPVIWMLSASFDRINTYELPMPPRFFPANLSLFNYQLVIKNMRILPFIMNTIFAALLSVALQLLIVPLAGFAFSKGRFPLKAFILLAIMSSMMVPFETRLMPIFMLMRSWGLNNSYLGIVLPAVMTSAFYIFLLKKAFDDLPNDLMESAYIDGASRLRIYFQIYLPLVGAMLATMVVLDVLAVWNDLLWPMVIINKINMSTIQVGLAMFASGGADNVSRHAGMASAASMLSILPLAVVFIFSQRYIVQSIAVSGIKQ